MAIIVEAAASERGMAGQVFNRRRKWPLTFSQDGMLPSTRVSLVPVLVRFKRLWSSSSEVAPFSWTVCRLAGYGSIRAASLSAS